MIKKIFLGLSLLIGSTALAQQGTASPYSFYGIGNVNFSGTNEHRAMGGISTYSDSIHLNLKNPASFSKLKMTTFTLGGTNTSSQFKSNEYTEKASSTLIDYIAVGIPLGRFGASFGILPFSSVGYKIHSEVAVGDQMRAKDFNGEGGINKAFAGLSYSILPNLQVGADFSYNFGDIDNNSTVFITDDGTGFFLAKGSRERIKTNYSGFSFNTGLIYTRKLKNLDWHNSATFSPQTKINAETTAFLETVQIANSGGVVSVETREQTGTDNDLTMPSKFSIGSGIGKANKWFVGAEFTQTQNSKLKNNWKTTEKAGFEDSQKYAIGGYYIPKYNSFTSYFDRVVYRAGFRYENTGLVLENQSINDYAFSLGAGFPVGRNFTNINLSLEYGQKGKTTTNLIKENYFNISVGISLNDLWFVKRRFE
ncbi:outer membrane protein transport protein [Flavobacterium sp. JP2137]|uniref:outer membrane protein transport protein n=1 Tax=Flavobacterium sp. JP2137 TaxID=3414510 RepID=UPI003D2F9FB0